MYPATEQLIEKIKTYLQSHPAEDEFNDLALQVAAYQVEYNPVMRQFYRQQGVTLRSLRNWSAIPAMPIVGFKELTLSCEPIEQAKAIYMTSGTTNPQNRGRHYHPTLEVYDASMQLAFQEFVATRITAPMDMGLFFPSPETMPNSSLAHYLDLASRMVGRTSAWLLDENGLQIEAAILQLQQSVQNGQPLFLAGATFGLVFLFDALKERGLTFQLASGSQLLDTGGIKGRTREITSGDLYRDAEELLGVPLSNCHNMFGMTELSTQYYEHGDSGLKKGPHWIRTRAVDPATLQPIPDGQLGLLVHYDLCNFNSSIAILSEDLGVTEAGGFRLIGRAAQADVRGCSVTVEELQRKSMYDE